MIEGAVKVQYDKHASFLRQIFSDSEGHDNGCILKMQHIVGDRSSGIYIVYNLKTGDFYIGSSIDIHKRRIAHTRAFRSEKWNSGSRLLRRHYKKYGENTFMFLKLQTAPEYHLKEVEEYWINQLDPFYNIARKSIRYIPGQDQRKKISDYSKSRRDNSVYKVAVIQMNANGEFIREWSSIKEATDGVGCKGGHISKACRIGTTAFGFKWKYKNGMTNPKPRYNK